MSLCFVCRKSTRNTAFIACSVCHKNYHGHCTDSPLSKEDIDGIVASKQQWRCVDCQASRRRSLHSVSDLSEPNNKAEVSDTKSFDDIYSLIVDLKSEIKNVERNLGDTINKLCDRLEESIKVIEVQVTKLN